MEKRRIEIMDTTLRDGEQTSGVSFAASEKLTLAKLLLEELKVDRIEIASARVSEGEFDSVRQITSWAAENDYLDRIEVLTFVDNGLSIGWMEKAGANVQNLLTKGSLNHLTHQLKKTPKAHFNDIATVLELSEKKGISTNVYLEDWSNGMRNSEDYVLEFLDFLSKLPLKRIMLPDTLGVLTHQEAYTYVSKIVERYPGIHFDFHIKFIEITTRCSKSGQLTQRPAFYHFRQVCTINHLTIRMFGPAMTFYHKTAILSIVHSCCRAFRNDQASDCEVVFNAI